MNEVVKYVGENLRFRWIKLSLFPAIAFAFGILVLIVKNYVGLRNLPIWWINLNQEAKLFYVLCVVLLLLAAMISIEFSRFFMDNWIGGEWNGIPLLSTYYEWLRKRQLVWATSLRDLYDECVITEITLTHPKYPHDLQELASLKRKQRYLEEERRYYPHVPDTDEKKVSLRPMKNWRDRHLQFREIEYCSEELLSTFGATRISNILAAASQYPKRRYGLAPNLTWIPLYFSLPKEFADELEAKKTNLIVAMRFLLVIAALGGVYVANSSDIISTIYVIGVFFLVFLLMRSIVVQAAKVYSELFRSAYDIYRFNIYEMLHLEHPLEAGNVELESGDRINTFLWRGAGAIPGKLLFVHPPTAEVKSKQKTVG